MFTMSSLTLEKLRQEERQKMTFNVINRETLENKKMIVVCPSRQRVEKLKEMLKGFYEKSSPSTCLLIMLDTDDPQLNQYKELLGTKTAYHIGSPMTTTNLYNLAFRMYPDFEYYCQFNDDCVPLTAIWDVKLMTDISNEDGWGISYGDDRVATGKYPSFPVISGNIVRALGWLQLPALKHLCGDWVWGAIGNGLGRLYYDSNVIIKHNHPFDKKTEPDEIFKKTNSKDMYKIDQGSFRQWQKSHLANDIQTVIREIFKEKDFDKTISLGMIIGQDEDIRNIKQCIDSVKDWVDELSVYINYSKYKKVWKISKIRKYISGCGIPSIVETGPFVNFSQARNVTLKQATKDYFLYLDCDDVMPAPWTMKDIISRFPAIDVFLCHVISHASYKGKGDEHITQSRLLKRHDYLEFRNNVHEDISFSYKENNARVIQTDIIIRHLGNTDLKRVKKKNLRNYQLTLKEINTDHAHSLTYFAIVNELMLMGDKARLAEAVQWVDKFFDKFPDNGNDPLVPKMWILRGSCAIDCGHVEAAKTNFAKAWHGWKHPEAAVMLGECHMRNQDWDKAIDILEEINNIEDFKVCNVPIDMKTLEVCMLSKLGWAYWNKAQGIVALKKSAPKMYNEDAHKIAGECLNKCKKAFSDFLSIEPYNLEIADKLAEIYRSEGDMNASNTITVSLVNMFPNYAIGWKNLGTFEAMNKRYETAKLFYEKSLKIDPRDEEIRHNLEMIRKSK